MRNAALAISLLLATAALAAPFTHTNGAAHYEDQALTRAVTATDTNQGVLFTNVCGFRIIICANSGQTLSGAGTIRLHLLDTTVGEFAEDGDLSWTISSRASGRRCWASPDFRSTVAIGRLLPATDGVTVSGGTTVRVYVRTYLRSSGC